MGNIESTLTVVIANVYIKIYEHMYGNVNKKLVCNGKKVQQQNNRIEKLQY